MIHEVNFRVIDRDKQGKATKWRGECNCGVVSWVDDDYYLVEEKWKLHLKEMKGSLHLKVTHEIFNGLIELIAREKGSFSFGYTEKGNEWGVTICLDSERQPFVGLGKTPGEAVSDVLNRMKEGTEQK